MPASTFRLSTTTLVFLLATAAGVAALVTALFVRDTGPKAFPELSRRIEVVGDVKQVMHMLDPSADAIWASVGTIATIDHVEERAPANEEEWSALERHAVTLAEAGNLLMLPGRARDDGEWMIRARALVDAGRAALGAVRSRNPATVMDVGEQITISCDACHQKYWDDTNAVVH